MKGILLLDKPAGITSFQACDKVRKKLKAEKAGHAGTLDPAVTGVLVIALNEATKIFPLLSGTDKKYEGTAHLHKEVSEKELKKGIKELQGKIKQLPPRRSRVKRQERERTVYEFRLLKKKNRDFSFFVHCQAGTYIRKLIHDLGEKLHGAHMTSLRRIQQGPFTEKETVKMQDLSEKNIIPIEKVIKKIKTPIVAVSGKEAGLIKNGEIIKTKINKKYETAAIFHNSGIIALAKVENNFLKPRRIIN